MAKKKKKKELGPFGKVVRGARILASANKNFYTGDFTVSKTRKWVKKKEDEDKKTRKSNLKIDSKYAKTAGERGEAKNRLIHGDEAINKLKRKHKRSEKKRAHMNKLRKTNPEAYKRRKKKQLKKEREAAFTARSSTWD